MAPPCWGARLSGLQVTPPAEVPPRYKPRLVPEVAADISSKLTLDAATAATILKGEATQRLAGASWFEATGDVVQGISQKARCADLVILGQYERQDVVESHPLPTAHSVVLRCGRPVLVVPAVTGPSALANIAIAWDGSREAVRAVHDALPLLRLSSSAQVMKMITPSEDDQADWENLSAHLVNHGIEVGPNVLQIRTTEEHKSLQRQIEDGHYDLLVMGGYSHAMWRQFIFGGANSHVVDNTGACLSLGRTK